MFYAIIVVENGSSQLLCLYSIQLESEVNHDVLRDLMPHVATAKTYLDRVFPSLNTVSEVNTEILLKMQYKARSTLLLQIVLLLVKFLILQWY